MLHRWIVSTTLLLFLLPAVSGAAPIVYVSDDGSAGGPAELGLGSHSLDLWFDADPDVVYEVSITLQATDGLSLETWTPSPTTNPFLAGASVLTPGAGGSLFAIGGSFFAPTADPIFLGTLTVDALVVGGLLELEALGGLLPPIYTDGDFSPELIPTPQLLAEVVGDQSDSGGGPGHERPIPEPGGALLFAAGAFLVALRQRKGRRTH